MGLRLAMRVMCQRGYFFIHHNCKKMSNLYYGELYMQEKSKEFQELVDTLNMAPNDYGYVKHHTLKAKGKLNNEEAQIIHDRYFANFSEKQKHDFILSMEKKQQPLIEDIESMNSFLAKVFGEL